MVYFFTKKISTHLLLALLLLVGCDVHQSTSYQPNKAHEEKVAVDADEEYVMVTTIVNFPMYVNHDQRAFIRWGKSRGVNTSILGPSEWDIQAQIATIEQVIGTRPTGLLINGTNQRYRPSHCRSNQQSSGSGYTHRSLRFRCAQ